MKNAFAVLIFLIVVIVSIFFIPSLLSDLLDVEQPVMTVVSGSMWPSLSRGDIIFVINTNDADIRTGSVIVFRHENGLSVHRVVSVDSWTITTRGDANVKDDNPILHDDVIGRVPQIGSWLMKIPWFGHIALLTNPQIGTVEPGEEAEVDFWNQLLRLVLSPVGFIIIIGFPLVIIFQGIITDVFYKIIPVSPRKQRSRARVKRLQARWGEEKTKHAMRI